MYQTLRMIFFLTKLFLVNSCGRLELICHKNRLFASDLHRAANTPRAEHLDQAETFQAPWINSALKCQQRRKPPGFCQGCILLMESDHVGNLQNVSFYAGATFLHPCDYRYQHYAASSHYMVRLRFKLVKIVILRI